MWFLDLTCDFWAKNAKNNLEDEDEPWTVAENPTLQVALSGVMSISAFISTDPTARDARAGPS
jgi:hypothetical protein